MNLRYLSVTEQARLVASGEVSARELTQHSLDVIARYNPDMKAFINVLVDEALTRADELDAELARTGQTVGPLHGVPIAVKDEYAVRGVRTGYGTNCTRHPAPADCEVVRRLREAGAIIIGVTAMPEFGQWPLTESVTHGYTRNPWNREYSVAGSSGGTAAAVASGMVAAGLGGDGGGSIRLPSAWCGLFGLKPQRGRHSLAPDTNLWHGLGVVGPLTRTVADSALLNDIMASHLPSDLYQAEPWAEPLTSAITRDPGQLRVLLAENPASGPKPDPLTRAALGAMGKLLADAGHHVEIGSLPKYAPGLAMIGQMAGGVSDEIKKLDIPERLEARTWHARRLYNVLGKAAPGAERKGEALAAQFNTVFSRYDVLLTPTIPTPPIPVGRLNGIGILGAITASLPITAYTAIWNVLGNPAAAVPAGFTPDGFPLSVQIVSAPHNEPLLIQLAAQIEKLAPWDNRHPLD